MLAGVSLGSDSKRYFRGTMPRIAIITIILMPLLYGAMYLWAFWNPFGAVDKIPAAIVNNDTGRTADGQQLDAGDQVVKSLIASGQLDLAEVSDEEASEGLASGKYYYTITLPENFSAAVESPNGANPEKAELIFTFNDANNYLATVIGQDASEQVINQVNSTIGAQGVGQVLTGLQSAGSGLQQAADGADQLAAGIDTAKSGADQLSSGANELATNMVTAESGSAQLASGAAQLATAIDGATTPLINALDSGSLPNVGGQVSELRQSLEALGSRLPESTPAPATAVSQALDILRQSSDPLVQRAVAALSPLTAQQVRGDTAELQAEINRLSGDARAVEYQLTNPSSPLQSGLATLQNGGIASDLRQLRSGADELSSGAATLSSGLVQLTDGSNQLASGAGQLASGMVELQSGSKELASALDEGAGQVPSWTDEQKTATADTLSTPVKLQQDYTNMAPTFGTGFAPFFLSLALFVGGIITWMLLTPLQSRPTVGGLGLYRTVFASYWPALLVGILQVVVMYTVVHFGVGLDVKHVFGTIAFLMLISATYLAMIQAFNAVFGIAVGRVVTLAFLMLQLVSAGGIYPVPTTAKPFQYIHPFDPMTYTVNGLRQLTIGEHVDSRLWIAIVVLVGILLVSLTASALSVRRNRHYTMERLYPPLEV
ncbi:MULTISPECIES: YhgE/Pip domain-containing protein [unclassified Rhodococcus (in: high G+C Gram-positive bacteria)]|uniref:YhgE/Pip domain-containing protein n=1 Tax=unclassified Rhodococcus (in: high G+C Gram-positive bacteria) TaxID=192944 RepID=UPI000BDAB1D2|nr:MULTISPECIES: YhgE/Pip domain-containing protein [unclassified Rhodococcus (in: high G+C Gram-positive bacteria)]MBP1159535.1 putative membrane protein [Rhodococcus sp. PvR099]PTR43535.1 putative membrane protein [Rhodococcus sp. OK611]SNX90880.1 putative membrane protein [Rhodococcus sp. OK270]